MRLMVLLCGLVLGVCPWSGHAEEFGELIEPHATGHINWTQGVVQAHGAETLAEAIDNVLQTVIQIRLDDESNVKDRVRSAPKMWAEVKAMASTSKLNKCDHSQHGNNCITLQMNLYGGFAQLLLPAAIKQVQPIKPLNGNYGSHGDSKSGVDTLEHAAGSEMYSGLIVDARDTGARPAMVPVLVDESGKEIYSPAFVSREFAVQQGVCQYVRYAQGLLDLPRVAPNPLLVKGLRTADDGSCNIVISNADASKLRSASAHLTFLKQCRVVIAID